MPQHCGTFQVFHEHRFGEFQFEPVGIQLIVEQCPGHQFDQIALLQLVPTESDCHSGGNPAASQRPACRLRVTPIHRSQ